MLHYVCLVVITAQPGANASITPELLCHQEPFRNSSIPTMETALGCAGRVWRLETNSNHQDATVSSTGGLMKWCWHLKWKSDLIKIDTIWWCLMTFDGRRLGHGKARLGPKLCQHKSEQFQFPIWILIGPISGDTYHVRCKNGICCYWCHLEPVMTHSAAYKFALRVWCPCASIKLTAQISRSSDGKKQSSVDASAFVCPLEPASGVLVLLDKSW